MLISDWSSDVGSSYLAKSPRMPAARECIHAARLQQRHRRSNRRCLEKKCPDGLQSRDRRGIPSSYGARVPKNQVKRFPCQHSFMPCPLTASTLICSGPEPIRRSQSACTPIMCSFPQPSKLGRASCRERVCQYVSISVVAVSLKKK